MLIEALLWFSAIGCGMLAGLFFAFSVFIMRALANLPQGCGMAAMVQAGFVKRSHVRTVASTAASGLFNAPLQLG